MDQMTLVLKHPSLPVIAHTSNRLCVLLQEKFNQLWLSAIYRREESTKTLENVVGFLSLIWLHAPFVPSLRFLTDLLNIFFLFNFIFIFPFTRFTWFLFVRIRNHFSSLPIKKNLQVTHPTFSPSKCAKFSCSFSHLWHLSLCLITAVPSLAMLQEEIRRLGTFTRMQAELLRTTCFTCEASGVCSTVIHYNDLQSPVGAWTWCGLS